MKYLKVNWIHTAGEEKEPTWLYSELDDSRWELRKVEVFADGHAQYADVDTQTGDTGLGLEPIPSIEEINNQKIFVAEEITADEFERVWSSAHQSAA